MNEVIQVVNKTIFLARCARMSPTTRVFLCESEVRWLSRRKSLRRVVTLRNETETNTSLCSQIPSGC